MWIWQSESLFWCSDNGLENGNPKNWKSVRYSDASTIWIPDTLLSVFMCVFGGPEFESLFSWKNLLIVYSKCDINWLIPCLSCFSWRKFKKIDPFTTHPHHLTGPFDYRTQICHRSTRLVWYSDGYCSNDWSANLIRIFTAEASEKDERKSEENANCAEKMPRFSAAELSTEPKVVATIRWKADK